MKLGYWGKFGLVMGAGVAVGALGAVLLSRGRIDLKKSAATILSHGMDIKEQAASFMENVKENVDDIVAEAQHERAKRQDEEA